MTGSNVYIIRTNLQLYNCASATNLALLGRGEGPRGGLHGVPEESQISLTQQEYPQQWVRRRHLPLGVGNRPGQVHQGRVLGEVGGGLSLGGGRIGVHLRQRVPGHVQDVRVS